MNGDEPRWRITGQNPTIKLLPGSQPTEGYDITFTTDRGTSGSVFVATAQIHDVAAIRGAIDRRVDQLHAIGDLTG